MKKLTLSSAALVLSLLLSFASFNLQADEKPVPPIDEKLVKLSIVDPVRDSGYTVGDLITRVVTLEIKKPYKLLDTSLPIVGYEKRYQGQVIGIELRDIKKSAEDNSDSTVHTLHLTYQIFDRNVVAKPAALPPEFIRIQGGNEVYSFRIPSWNFRISPIAVFGEVKLESDMSPLRGPMLKTSERENLIFKLALAVLGLSALGLLYILGMRAWLPRMGGPFARACRDLKKLSKLPANDETLKLALTRVHQAFNLSSGSSVFSNNVDDLLAQKPVFAGMRDDIAHFFELSRMAFFEQHQAAQTAAEQLAWLQKFSRRCRDCERGLRPEKQA